MDIYLLYNKKTFETEMDGREEEGYERVSNNK